MLRTPPSFVNKDDKVDPIEPLLMADDIIRVRKEVATKWKCIIVMAPESQSGIRKDLLTRQMMKWGQHVDRAHMQEADTIEQSHGFQ